MHFRGTWHYTFVFYTRQLGLLAAIEEGLILGHLNVRITLTGIKAI